MGKFRQCLGNPWWWGLMGHDAKIQKKSQKQEWNSASERGDEELSDEGRYCDWWCMVQTVEEGQTGI